MLLAMAGALAATALMNADTVITPDDYPQGMVDAGQSAIVDIEVLVSPTGQPETCHVIGVVRARGFVEQSPAEKRTCSLFLKRGKFTPARDADGNAAYGTYRNWVRWATGDGLDAGMPAQVDLEIQVAALPAGVPSRSRVAVDLAVSADGKPGPCAAAVLTAPKPTEILSPPLARAACATLAGSATLGTIVNFAGQPVPTVRRMTARFVVEQAPDKTS